MMETRKPLIGVGAVAFKGEEVLLVRRGKPPFLGQWSIPGGRLEFGETLRTAAAREVFEETAVRVAIGPQIGVFEALPADVGGAGHMVMIDFLATWASGAPIAGDDAAEAAFLPIDEAMRRLEWDKTRDALARAIEMR